MPPLLPRSAVGTAEPSGKVRRVPWAMRWVPAAR
ncbi:hypothetical protein ALMP_19380, partial [Streptomyces sp. A012304]